MGEGLGFRPKLTRSAVNADVLKGHLAVAAGHRAADAVELNQAQPFEQRPEDLFVIALEFLKRDLELKLRARRDAFRKSRILRFA